ncbi:MAG: DnaJ domain-containing protein [Tatlockia sp.]|nr:DnaJ domain-containing protein [Tatlockia sp.]
MKSNELVGNYEERLNLVKAQYKKLAKQHHPDKGGQASDFQKINDAYSFLMDEKNKKLIMNEQSSKEAVIKYSEIHMYQFKEVFEDIPSRFCFICDDLIKTISKEKSSYFAKLNFQTWELYQLNKEIYKEKWIKNHTSKLNLVKSDVIFLRELIDTNRLYYITSWFFCWTFIVIPLIVYFYNSIKTQEAELKQKEILFDQLREEQNIFNASEEDAQKIKYMKNFDLFIKGSDELAEGKYLISKKNATSTLIHNFEIRIRSLKDSVKCLNMPAINEKNNISGFHLVEAHFKNLMQELPVALSSSLKNQVIFANYKEYLLQNNLNEKQQNIFEQQNSEFVDNEGSISEENNGFNIALV